MVNVRELALLNLVISKTSIQVILKEKRKYRKVYANWVTKMLTEEYKRQCVIVSREFFECYVQEKKDLLNSIFTSYETRGSLLYALMLPMSSPNFSTKLAKTF